MAAARASQPVCLMNSTASMGSVRQAWCSSTVDVFLDTAEHAELGLDGDAGGMGAVDDALGDLDVFLERLVGGVDHDGAVEAGVDAIVATGLVAMVEVDGENGVGPDFLGGPDDGLEHLFLGVGACAL